MKLKSLILSFALTLFAVSGLLAQDKYEYGTLVYQLPGSNLKNGLICISKPGSYEETKADVKEGFHFTNTTPALASLDKLSNEGWEVYSTGEMGNNFIFYLRKKKN